MKKWITFIAATLVAAGGYAATLEDWQFNDANGTALNAVTNTGTVGTSWNFGGPSTQAGSLNIGDTTYYKWDVGTGTTFRTAAFADLTTGKYVFEVVIADWDLGGADGLGDTGNGIKFNVGGTTGKMQLEFEVSQTNNDIRVRSQNSNDGSLSGTDAQNQLGGLDLTNSASVTVQLIADLDTGVWSTRVDYNGSWTDLVTDGAGMNSINQIQLIADGSNGSGWEYGGVGGTATEFIKIDSVTLSEWVEEVADPWTQLEQFNFDDVAGKSFNTFVNSGTLNSSWNYGGPAATIFTDGAGSLVVSNHPGQTYRKINSYASPYTSGVYRLEMDLASWDLDAAAVGSTLTFGAVSDATDVLSLIAAVRLTVQDATTARVQMFGDFTSGATYRAFDFSLADTNGLSCAIDFDFDADTATYSTNGVETHSFTNFQGTQVESLQFNTSSTWTTNSVAAMNAIGFSEFVGTPATNDTATSLWNEWINLYSGVGSNSNLLDHGDSDDLDNLTEYAFGGDPSDGGSQGNIPSQSLVDVGGTDYIEYVYYMRDDAGGRGLAYLITTDTDLVAAPGWTNAHYEVTGTNTSTGISGFNAVTNRMSTDPEAQRFLRLQIEFTP